MEKCVIETKAIGSDVSCSSELVKSFNGIICELSKLRRQKAKAAKLQCLLILHEWHRHYESKQTGCVVLNESAEMEFPHELVTAQLLADEGYNVLFAPKELFGIDQKKFDVFLIKDHLFLKGELKCISSKRSKTISNRIMEGAEQAERVIVDMRGDIAKKTLINALRRSARKANLLTEIWLFYKNSFYTLPRKMINSRKISKLIQ